MAGCGEGSRDGGAPWQSGRDGSRDELNHSPWRQERLVPRAGISGPVWLSKYDWSLMTTPDATVIDAKESNR